MTSHHFCHDNLSPTSIVFPLENGSLLPVFLLLLCFSTFSFAYSKEVIWLVACTKFWNINYILSFLWILQRILISLTVNAESYSGLPWNMLSPSSLALTGLLTALEQIFMLWGRYILFLHAVYDSVLYCFHHCVPHIQGTLNVVSTVNSSVGC